MLSWNIIVAVSYTHLDVYKRQQFKLNGLPADEFPELPSFEQATVYQVDQNLLRDCIRRTEYALSLIHI